MIDCAEFTGPADDMKIGVHTIWKNFYPSSMHEPATVLELLPRPDRIEKDRGKRDRTA